MFWYILLIFFVWLLITLLFAPLKLSLSTANNLYFISWGGALKASASILKDDVELRFHLFSFSRSVSLLEIAAGQKRKKSVPEKIVDNVVNTTNRRVPIGLLKAVVKSFRVKRFYVNIDWGSVFWNAWLYPLGEIFYQKNFYITTNFSGQTDVEIVIINRPARMLWAVLKTYLNKKS